MSKRVNMKNKMIILHTLIIVLLFQHETNGKEYNIKLVSDRGVCNYDGYIPGGKKIGISPIQAPTAKMETDILSKVAGFAGKGASAANVEGEIAPKLGSALSEFGVVFGTISGLTKLSPQVMLDAINEAIEKLIKEVNDRFIYMKDYVDLETMNVVQERINVEYRHMVQMFSNCIEETTLARAVECEEDASRYIRSGFSKFMLFKEELAKYSESSLPTGKDIRKMELTMLPFREYATLNLMQLQVLKDTFRDKKSLQNRDELYKKHLKELSNDAKIFINYAKDMFKWILYIHDTHARKQCDDTKTTWSRCTYEGSWTTHTYCTTSVKCQFDLTISENKKCEKKNNVRADGQTPWTNYNFPGKNLGYKEIGIYFNTEKLDETHESYVNQLAQDAKNYWESEILSSIPTWQQIKDLADNELSKLEDDISIASGNRQPQNFNTLRKDDDLETSYALIVNPNDNQFDHQSEDEKSRYPSSYDFQYVNSNDETADNISKRDATSPLQKYEEVRNDMMLLEDMPLSPRFKERYLRAYNTLKYFEDRDRSKMKDNGYEI